MKTHTTKFDHKHTLDNKNIRISNPSNSKLIIIIQHQQCVLKSVISAHRPAIQDTASSLSVTTRSNLDFVDPNAIEISIKNETQEKSLGLRLIEELGVRKWRLILHLNLKREEIDQLNTIVI